ncbi:ABC transporter permease [Puniceibacterium sp. IMCC21224]|uniref:ABC transporter permease n=1 Tax=Puniceibacterium sp. IMCC21224 TaxID=1618204 RepID=UPI00064DF3AD|nr:ABC transporter permease [Puniceibacterium sp. IMCC21224]KMK64977.1 ABC-type nitrate/sulfonate/bicarbonate transport system, permease component [Puniceibacterium sp. IMCC21224]
MADTNITFGQGLRRIWFRSQGVLMPVITLIILLAIWEIAVVGFAIPEYLLPAPSQIWIATSAQPALVWGHTMATLKTVLLGFGLSISVSLPLAFALTASQTVASAVYPLLILTQSIPKVALAPILVIALGANEMPRIIITFLVAFFPLVIAITTGLLSVPSDLVELGRSYRASRLQQMVMIRMPYAIPFIFSGLKTAVALAVVGAVVGEFVTSDRGLGYLIQTSTAFFRMPLAYGAMLVLSAMGIILFQLVAVTERLLFPWATANREQ